MYKPHRFAALVSLGLAFAPSACFAQAPAEHTTVIPLAPAIPPDQQPSKEQLAKLFEVMRLREQMQSLMKMMPVMIQQQVQAQMKEMTSKKPGGGSPSPEQQAALDQLMSKYMKKAFEMYTIDEMLGDMTTIYQRHMSRSDVDAFIAFYSSPAGQHMLNEQPAIMREYMPLVTKRVQERSKALTDEMMNDLEGITKSAAPSASQPAPK
jgi:hypothetical protein